MESNKVFVVAEVFRLETLAQMIDTSVPEITFSQPKFHRSGWWLASICAHK